MKKDSLCKAYLKRKEIFADAFNFFLYDGKTIIEPSKLKELDTSEIAMLKNNVSIQRHRDLLKKVTIMQDDKECYMLLGIESQSFIDYGMVARCMLYDAISYENQIKDLVKINKDAKMKTGNEFLSHMGKGTKIKPVITLVIYFGPDNWDGPRQLYDLIDIGDESLKRFISNYQLNLICPFEINDNEFKKFKTDLYNVLSYIKAQNDENKINSLLNDENWNSLNSDTYNLINELTGSELKFKESGGNVDMCKGIDDMRRHAEERGKLQGIEEGKIQGIEESIYKLYCKGIKKEEISNLLDIKLEDIDDIIKSKELVSA